MKTFHWIANLRDWFKQFWDRQQQVGFLWDRNPCLSFLQQVLDSTNKWFNQVETEFVRRSLQRQRNNRRGTIGLVVIGFALVWLFAGCQGSHNQQTQIDPIKNDKVKVLKAEIIDYKVLNYLKKISGSQTVAGQHNKECKPQNQGEKCDYQPDKSTEKIKEITGKDPGLWSGDFLFWSDVKTNRQKMIAEAKRQWDQGAIINLMYHACPPTEPEPCGVKVEDAMISNIRNLDDDEWKQLLADGEDLNKKWKSRLDTVADFLLEFKYQGVEVLWRPLHEINKSNECDIGKKDSQHFWWAGRPEESRKLYQITHDYLVKQRGLTNLIWVWYLQDCQNLRQQTSDYNPGDSYWDIAALDIYESDGELYSQDKYDAMKDVAKGKPIAIGECFKLPDVELLKKQPLWTFFMGWDECVYCQNKDECPDYCSVNNSKEKIRKLYNAPNILTLKKRSEWGR